jgi:hypothetical protein
LPVFVEITIHAPHKATTEEALGSTGSNVT